MYFFESIDLVYTSPENSTSRKVDLDVDGGQLRDEVLQDKGNGHLDDVLRRLAGLARPEGTLRAVVVDAGGQRGGGLLGTGL